MDLLSFLWTNGVAFVFILTVVVFIHEMGHYLIARRNGVRVEVFSIGFGPELFGWQDRAGTRWKVSVLPLGGYVKMFGEHSGAGAGDRPMTPEEEAVSFPAKSLGQRAAIVVSGPLANFVLAIALLAGLFTFVGQPFTAPIVGVVEEESAAEAGGLQPGDRVLVINGHRIERFEDIQHIVQVGLGEPLTIVVERDGREVTLFATPKVIEHTDRFGNTYEIGRLGIRSGGVNYVRHDPLSAVWHATEAAVNFAGMTLKGLAQMIAGTRSADDLRGPIGILQLSGQVAQMGLVPVIQFMAWLSLALGLINLFPIPVLDGGHLLFYAVEAVLGRPLGARAQEYGLRIGLALVLTLIVFVTWNDLVRLLS